MTKNAALKCGQARIRVNSIHLGNIDTPMAEAYIADMRKAVGRLRQVPIPV
jgi:NAD(P)-dependent dehydrogenase (short-subunit alcohol dehydrogenase family)